MFVKQSDAPQAATKWKSKSTTFWPNPVPKGMWCQWSVSNPKMNLQSNIGNCMSNQIFFMSIYVKMK